ncbi:MAG: SOS response-associated peptidase [Clostridiales bacterium]|nr:SOS response-associated peptidase [Clostridiales bacterium]
MCGRYFFNGSGKLNTVSPELQEMLLSICDGEDRHDVVPGTSAPVITYTNGVYRVENMYWGFKSEKGGLVINARGETVGEKSMFSDSVNRCIIPASGYYEWRRGDRQKFSFICKEECELMYIAGLSRYYEGEEHFVVITRPPIEAVSKIHNRMPLILSDRRKAAAYLKGGDTSAFISDDIEIDIRAEGDEQLSMVF